MITKLVVLSLLILIVIVDVFLWVCYGSNATISWFLWTTSHDWPIIPFLFGVLAGHLFFSQPHIPPTT